MQRQILVAVEEFLFRPISSQTKNPMFGVLEPLTSRSCIVVPFKRGRAPPMTFGNLLVRTILKVWSDGFRVWFVSLSLASASP